MRNSVGHFIRCILCFVKGISLKSEKLNVLFSYGTEQPFVRLYNIELGDQEFFTQFVSIDILWALRLHIVLL